MTKLITPGISRRGLMRTAAAATAAGLILPGLGGAARAEPKRGGIFRVGIGHGSTTDTLDPGLWDNLYVQVFAAARHNQLIEVDADSQLAPEIAESWESDDGATWVFKIREGVTFHSGKTLTIDDVLASLNHHRGDASTSAVKPFFDAVTDIRADGQNLVVVLNAPNADFPYLMSDYHLPIMPAVDGKIDVDLDRRRRRLHHGQLRARRAGHLPPQPGLLEVRPRPFRRARDPVDPRFRRPPQRADDRRGRHDRPGRSRDHRDARVPRRQPHPVDLGQRALLLPDGQPRGALRQQRRAARAQVRLRPAGAGGQDPRRPRLGVERQPDRPGEPLLPCRDGGKDL
jgi:hypothetical protein